MSVPKLVESQGNPWMSNHRKTSPVPNEAESRENPWMSNFRVSPAVPKDDKLNENPTTNHLNSTICCILKYYDAFLK